MVLPILTTLRDCAEYSKTVEPYLPQLYALPQKIIDNALSPAGLRQVYIETNPLMSGLAFSIFLSFIFLVVSEVNRNYSQVDRMWSILPNLYIVHLAVWARAAGVPADRITLVAAFSTLWSIRLTFNYWRRGGYEVGSEDYRWAILQKYVNRPIWFIFNITFISLIQSVLLWSFSCVPAYTILITSKFQPEISVADWFYFVVEVVLVFSEWVSDGQQWDFQTKKYAYKDDGKVRGGYTKEEFERGFRTTGLFAYSRHPNFFAEQAVWFMLYQWACFSINTLYNWTFAGAGSLILLFQGSTLLTEMITSSKYPEYKEYQKQVPMFMPSIRHLKGYTPPSEKSSEAVQKKEGKKQK